MLLIIFWMMLLGPNALGEAGAARTCVRVSARGKRGLIFFFTDRGSLTPNFSRLYEQVPRASLGKV